jgi:D-3-phosphoglycerate dehydrogenase
MNQIVAFAHLAPGTEVVEEMEALDAPGIEIRLCGPCKTPEELIAAIQGAEVAMCMKEPYTREVLASAPQLKMVMRYGVGVDTVDLEAATEYGIVVGHFPDFCIPEVANHALAHLLVCAKKMRQLDHRMRTSGWAAARAPLSPMGPIHGETVGLIAFGNIARAMAVRVQALNMKVIAYDPYIPADVFEAAGVEPVSLEELAARSDYVSCHLPLNDQTRGILDAGFFSQMKRTACFINTGRGAVVVESALVAALQEGRIAGAGLDVFEHEPISVDHPLCAMENVMLTPHTASYADQTMAVRRRRVGYSTLSVLQGGLPEFVANPAVVDHRRK